MTAGPTRCRQTLVRGLAALALAVLAAGCAGLPQQVDRTPSEAAL
ncbi:MAG: hypothetical protein ACHP83_11550 [Burkholderiales bacterium]